MRAACIFRGAPQYEFNLKHFGHPSEYGYKDISHNWVIDRWKPNELMDLYVEMGARYFMAMGVHHDNFDCWDSAYQPWNSVRVGPKVDIVGTWEKVAREARPAFRHRLSQHSGANLGTVHAGALHQRQEWADERRALRCAANDSGWKRKMVGRHGSGGSLRASSHQPNDPLHSPFANQFMWRVDDAITKYHPDVIYFDEHAGDSQVDMGVHMGLGFLAPPLAANYYNKSLKWNHGKMEVVLNLKGVGGRYNSFQNSPELLPFVDRSLVKSTEAVIEPADHGLSVPDRNQHRRLALPSRAEYMDARSIIRSLMQNVCRNGTMLLNLTQHGRGDLDPQVIQIAKTSARG